MLVYHNVVGHREIIEDDGRIVARISDDATKEQVARLEEALRLLYLYERKVKGRVG